MTNADLLLSAETARTVQAVTKRKKAAVETRIILQHCRKQTKEGDDGSVTDLAR